MSGHYNLKSNFSSLSNYGLSSFRQRAKRELIQLNRRMDPKFGYEQEIVADEIMFETYVDGDNFAFDALPDRVFRRMKMPALKALLNDGRVRIETFSFDPKINGADLPDTPDSPYVMAIHDPGGFIGVPVTLGCRALVFRASLDPYAHLCGTNACLAIEDTDGFVSCITRKLNQVFSQAGSKVIRILHAPCVYQWSRLVGTHAGRTDDASHLDAEDAKYFIKPSYGYHDAEFRFVWILDQDFEGYVDVQCPDLAQYCSVFSDRPLRF